MDENRLSLLEAQITAQSKAIEEIKTTQLRIANALLGSLDEHSVGLIEEVRNLKSQIIPLQTQIKELTDQVNLLETFKNDVKKVVAGIAIVIPLLVEVIKFGLTAVWELVRTGPK